MQNEEYRSQLKEIIWQLWQDRLKAKDMLRKKQIQNPRPEAKLPILEETQIQVLDRMLENLGEQLLLHELSNDLNNEFPINPN